MMTAEKLKATPSVSVHGRFEDGEELVAVCASDEADVGGLTFSFQWFRRCGNLGISLKLAQPCHLTHHFSFERACFGLPNLMRALFCLL